MSEMLKYKYLLSVEGNDVGVYLFIYIFIIVFFIMKGKNTCTHTKCLTSHIWFMGCSNGA